MRPLIIALAFLVCTSPALAQTTFYVDNTASGADDGTSWTDAWPSFAAVNWGSISAGDTLAISGGTTTKTYKETLTVGQAGTNGSPVTILAGQDANHNGQVIIDGDVDSDGGVPEAGDLQYGIVVLDWVTVNGELSGEWNLLIRNTHDSAIRHTGAAGNQVLYVQTYNTGSQTGGNGGTIHLSNCQSCVIANNYIDFGYNDAIPDRRVAGWLG